MQNEGPQVITGDGILQHLANGKGRLELPPGDFVLSGNFESLQELELVGSGFWQTRLICEGLHWQIRAPLRLRGVHLFDGHLVLHSSVDVDSCWISDSRGQQASLQVDITGDLHLRHSRVERNLWAGVENLGGKVRLEHVHFVRPGRSGFLQLGKGQLEAIHCIFEDGLGAAVRLEAGQGQIKECQFQDCRVGIRLDGEADLKVGACRFLGGEVGLRSTGDSRLTIEDARIAGMEEVGVALSDRSHLKMGHSHVASCRLGVSSGDQSQVEIGSSEVARCSVGLLVDEEATASAEEVQIQFCQISFRGSGNSRLHLVRCFSLRSQVGVYLSDRVQCEGQRVYCQDNPIGIQCRGNAKGGFRESWLLDCSEGSIDVADGALLTVDDSELMGPARGSWTGQGNKQGWLKNLFHKVRALPRPPLSERGCRIPLDPEWFVKNSSYFGLEVESFPLIPADERQRLDSRLHQQPWPLAKELCQKVESTREPRYLSYALGALEKANSGAGNSKDRAEICAWWGRALLRNGETEAGVAKLRQALSLDPESPVLWEIWAEFFSYDSQASETLAKGLQLHPNSSQLHYWMGNFLNQQQGLLAEALPLYARALELDPQHLGAWSNRGVCWLELGECDKAIESLRQALHIDHTDEISQGQLIRAYLKLAERIPRDS